MHHQHRRDLAENGEPAQADQRIQPNVARTFVSPWQTKHGPNVAAGGAISKPSQVPLETAAPMRDIRGNPHRFRE